MNPQQLSHELRQGEGADLARRRWIIGLSIVGSAIAQAVSLYQTGIIRHLPDPPLPYFDSSRVDASTYAYSRLDSPDGPAMLVNYGITAWLAAAGGKDRAAEADLAACERSKPSARCAAAVPRSNRSSRCRQEGDGSRLALY